MDLISCFLLFLSCLARTTFRMTVAWRRFDLFCFLPVSGITTTASNFITLAVVIGRYFHKNYVSINRLVREIEPEYSCSLRHFMNFVFSMLLTGKCDATPTTFSVNKMLTCLIFFLANGTVCCSAITRVNITSLWKLCLE